MAHRTPPCMSRTVRICSLIPTGKVRLVHRPISRGRTEPSCRALRVRTESTDNLQRKLDCLELGAVLSIVLAPETIAAVGSAGAIPNPAMDRSKMTLLSKGGSRKIPPSSHLPRNPRASPGSAPDIIAGLPRGYARWREARSSRSACIERFGSSHTEAGAWTQTSFPPRAVGRRARSRCAW